MNKTIISSFVGTVAAIAVIIGITRLLGPIPLSISETLTNKQNSFDVSGEGKITTDPDRAILNLGVTVNSDTVSKTQDQGNKIINLITTDVLKLGIDKADIKTINYSLYPNYNFQTGTQKITGYALNVTIQVATKDFAKINQVIDAATQDGANQVGGVSFTLTDSKKLDVENQAREMAVSAAKEKANSLAKISGIRLGRIINVTENNSMMPQPVPYMMTKEAVAPGTVSLGTTTPTDVNPGSTTFSLTVTLSYETL